MDGWRAARSARSGGSGAGAARARGVARCGSWARHVAARRARAVVGACPVALHRASSARGTAERARGTEQELTARRLAGDHRAIARGDRTERVLRAEGLASGRARIRAHPGRAAGPSTAARAALAAAGAAAEARAVRAGAGAEHAGTGRPIETAGGGAEQQRQRDEHLEANVHRETLHHGKRRRDRLS